MIFSLVNFRSQLSVTEAILSRPLWILEGWYASADHYMTHMVPSVLIIVSDDYIFYDVSIVEIYLPIRGKGVRSTNKQASDPTQLQNEKLENPPPESI